MRAEVTRPSRHCCTPDWEKENFLNSIFQMLIWSIIRSQLSKEKGRRIDLCRFARVSKWYSWTTLKNVWYSTPKINRSLFHAKKMVQWVSGRFTVLLSHWKSKQTFNFQRTHFVIRSRPSCLNDDVIFTRYQKSWVIQRSPQPRSTSHVRQSKWKKGLKCTHSIRKNFAGEPGLNLIFIGYITQYIHPMLSE